MVIYTLVTLAPVMYQELTSLFSISLFWSFLFVTLWVFHANFPFCSVYFNAGSMVHIWFPRDRENQNPTMMSDLIQRMNPHQLCLSVITDSKFVAPQPVVKGRLAHCRNDCRAQFPAALQQSRFGGRREKFDFASSRFCFRLYRECDLALGPSLGRLCFQ